MKPRSKIHLTWALAAVVCVACGDHKTKKDPCGVHTAAGAYAVLAGASEDRITMIWDEQAARPASVSGKFLTVENQEVEAALSFWRWYSGALQRSVGDVSPRDPKNGQGGVYVRLQHIFQGYEIFGEEFVVRVGGAAPGYRIMNVRDTTQDIEDANFEGPIVSAEEAGDIARRYLGLSDAEVVVRLGLWRADALTQAFLVRVAQDSPRVLFDVFVDAISGNVVDARDRLWRADGTGMVFDANPIASTGDTSLQDLNDADSTALTNARFSVTLPHLDASGFLRGSYVDARTLNSSARAQDVGLSFNFMRSATGFEETMAYYHIDRAQQRIQSLGYNNVNNRQQLVIINGQTDDNSFYDPSVLDIRMGTGGVDDAEDADILLHEYGHSIQDNQVPGFGLGGNAGAIGEGFGDYFAASMSDTLTQTAGHPQTSADAACVGEWDSVGFGAACLRRVDSTKHFPEFFEGEVHADGEMWSAPLFRARDTFGANVVDSLVLESHFSMTASESFAGGAQAVLDADQTLYSGTHLTTLRRYFVDQGLLRSTTAPANMPTVLSSTNVSLSNPRPGGVYANNLDHSQLIVQAGAQALRLHFTQIATELDPGCFAGACDSIYLYDVNGDLFQILSGNQSNVLSVVIPGDTVRVRLVTDVSVGAFGYTIDRIDQMGPPPVCGDNLRQGAEQCDGSDFGGNDCTDLGFASGTLGCSGCSFDTSACVPFVCGNNLRQGIEQCDGLDLNNNDCIDLGFTGGTLGCSGSCTFDTTGCEQIFCGNGVLDLGEACESANFATTCGDLGFAGGSASCVNCQVDSSQCLSSICGNGVLETPEACDGGVTQNCTDLGFVGGLLTCGANCTLDTSGCTPAFCGNGIREGIEDCDGADLGSASCLTEGLANGILRCSSACTFDVSVCLPSECR